MSSGGRKMHSKTVWPSSRSAPLPRYVKKIGRNEPCPCGSGKKYKEGHAHEGEPFLQKLAHEEEKKRQQEFHYMRCPKCGMQLIEIDYRGIEIDKCSECEGVWLDAGELQVVSKMEKRGLEMLFSVFTGKDLKK